MVPVLEAIPNFSEGRDLGLVRELVAVIARRGAEVLDWSADPDHNRSVVTFVGDPATVEASALAAARLAVETIDLGSHRGVHPRIGALDVLPFVPLLGLEPGDAVAVAHRVGQRLAEELGLPVYFYGHASDPPGRGLAQIREGGFEALRDRVPGHRTPDVVPPGWSRAGLHPSAGATCVGARGPLLAWNVHVTGLELAQVRTLAARLREAGGGFPGLRTLGLELARQGRIQLSMNLEDPDRTSPFQVFEAIEAGVREMGGAVEDTEIVGMIPGALVLPAASDRLRLRGSDPSRFLEGRLATHVAARCSGQARALADAVRAAGDGVPPAVRKATERLAGSLAGEPPSDMEP